MIDFQAPTKCECGKPCMVLTNGARSQFCEECYADLIGARQTTDKVRAQQVKDLTGDWDAMK